MKMRLMIILTFLLIRGVTLPELANNKIRTGFKFSALMPIN